MKFSLAFILMAASQICLANTNSLAGEDIDSNSSPSIAVIQYLKGTPNLAVLSAGKNQNILPGSLVKSKRPMTHQSRGLPFEAASINIETGTLKVAEVGDDFAIAEILVEGSAIAQQAFPNFPGVMIGDKVEASQPSIDLKMNIVPDMVLSYFELFDEPQSYPGSFELSEEGRQRLKIVGQQLGKMPVGLLMVQGFTDRNGPSEINQVESYQRALTVRQHLIEELGFDPKRVEAIGFGEGEPTDHSMVSGYIINNRRIVLKVLNSI